MLDQNDYASEPVTGSVSTPRAGATTGPDLLSVVVDATNAANKLVVFTFDENIDPAPAIGIRGWGLRLLQLRR